jgi:acyl carrier protein
MTSIDRDKVVAWLTERVAFYVERDPAEIEPDKNLLTYGIDSVYALGIAGDVEEEFGTPVDATLVWDNPTIAAIATAVTAAAVTK